MSAESQGVVLGLTDDFELPVGEAKTVRAGLDAMRANWARGNACLT